MRISIVVYLFIHLCLGCKFNLPPDKEFNSNVLPPMVNVSGGNFTMGNNNGGEAERPAHTVSISPLKVSLFEVTNKDYALYCVNTNETLPLPPSWGFDKNDLPVVNIKWEDAIKYCNWLSSVANLTPAYEITGTNITLNQNSKGFRLLTEAEWEFVAKGGTKSQGFIYAGSNSLNDVGWFSQSKAQPIRQKNSNELGIYDLSGNVSEWCFDWYDQGYYAKSPTQNPTGPITGNEKVVRGGSWQNQAVDCRVVARNFLSPSFPLPFVGFRVCQSI
jgi:sulfatase modifying factor 1